MPTIRTRAGKGSVLTPTEADTNMKRPAISQATNYNVAASHNRDIHYLSNGVTATLPAASGLTTEPGDWFCTFKATGASATIGRTGADTIDGAASNITLTQYEVLTLRLNAAGTGYSIEDRYVATLPVARGGTGSATASGARTNLGLAYVAGSVSFNSPMSPGYVDKTITHGLGTDNVDVDWWLDFTNDFADISFFSYSYSMTPDVRTKFMTNPAYGGGLSGATPPSSGDVLIRIANTGASGISGTLYYTIRVRS